MSELHDAIRFLADHLFRDASADSNAKRAALEDILSPAPAGAVAEPEPTPPDAGPTPAETAPAAPFPDVPGAVVSSTEGNVADVTWNSAVGEEPVNPQVV